MIKYRAVIFDLDGTVLDTLGDLAASVNHTLEKHSLPQRTPREVRSFVGNGVKNLVFRAAGENVSDEEKEEMVAEFRTHYGEHCADSTVPYEGIKELLFSLKRDGVKLAVVSNKPDSEVQALVDKNFPGIFGYVAGEKAGIERKPAPDSVFAALDFLGEKACDAAYVGDSEVDILTAANSRTDGIIVTWGFRDRDFLVSKGAERPADTADELKKLLYY